MKKLALLVVSAAFIIVSFSAFAEEVSGYYRKNGTYVQSYERTAPDNTRTNNYDYPGNYNPNTGGYTQSNNHDYSDNYNSRTGRHNY